MWHLKTSANVANGTELNARTEEQNDPKIRFREVPSISGDFFNSLKCFWHAVVGTSWHYAACDRWVGPAYLACTLSEEADETRHSVNARGQTEMVKQRATHKHRSEAGTIENLGFGHVLDSLPPNQVIMS
jgi:hypothetical protein